MSQFKIQDGTSVQGRQVFYIRAYGNKCTHNIISDNDSKSVCLSVYIVELVLSIIPLIT